MAPTPPAPAPATPKRRHRFRPHAWEPLTMTWAEVAHTVFRRNEMWLRENLPANFPRPSATYGHFHVDAVEQWARRHWGLISPDATKEERQARIREKLHARREGLLPGQKTPIRPRAALLATDQVPGRRRVLGTRLSDNATEPSDQPNASTGKEIHDGPTP